MKLSAVVLVSALEAAKLHTPAKQLEKLKKSINFVWDEWFAANCQNHVGRRDRLLRLVTRIGKQFDECGTFDPSLPNGGPPARRRRDDNTDNPTANDSNNEEDSKKSAIHDLCVDQDGTNMCAEDSSGKTRVSKVDKNLASKQIGKLIKKFGERYLTKCEKGLNAEKLAAKGKKWENHLKNQKCANRN